MSWAPTITNLRFRNYGLLGSHGLYSWTLFSFLFLNMYVEEDEELIIEMDDVVENKENIDLCIVGKFLSD